jgi:hypothetical protein
MRPLQNKPQIAAIAGITERELSAVLSPERALVDPLALIDLVVAVVHQYGVDANWLLTGEYIPAWHRQLDAEGPLSPSRVRGLIAERLPTYSPYRPTVKFPS